MEPEENVDEMLLRKQTAEHLFKMGNYLSSSCPAASRFYMFNFEKRNIEIPNLLKNYSKLSYQFCHHCGSIWSPDNCNIHIQKKRSLNGHLKKLLNLEANQPWKLNNRQKKNLRKFRESTSKLVYSCLACKKKTFYPGTKKSNIKCQSLGHPFSSTPQSKKKFKKGDLNAGLFIASPSTPDAMERNNLEKSGFSVKSKECETPLSGKDRSLLGNQSSVISGDESSNTSWTENKITPRMENKITPRTVKPTSTQLVSSSEKQSASKKRKKTLLAQILNQEQNKKKKANLSSFLMSL